VVSNFSLILSGKHFGPTEIVTCLLIRSGCLIRIGSYGGRACIVIHTLDRYWKIVHPIHHRKCYRRWMSHVGLVLPWLLGVVLQLPSAVATTRLINGMCIAMFFWSSETQHMVCCYCLKQIDLYFCYSLLLGIRHCTFTFWSFNSYAGESVIDSWLIFMANLHLPSRPPSLLYLDHTNLGLYAYLLITEACAWKNVHCMWIT